MRMRKKGFTLIELLVVISIIALLLSVIMPSLNKAKEAARSVVCRNNLRQFGIGFQAYYLENDNKALVSEGAEIFWFIQIGPYLGDGAFTFDANLDPETELTSSMATIKCPSTKPPTKEWDPSQPPWSPVNTTAGTARNQYRYHMTRVEGSYGINSWVGGWVGGQVGDENFNPKTPKGRENIKKSYRDSACGKANVPLIADAIWVDVWPKTSNDSIPDESQLEDGIWKGLGRTCTDRHGLDTSVVYCDGHVEKIKLYELWSQRWHKEFNPNHDVQVPRAQ